MFKKIALAVVLGAATTLGSILMNKGYNVVTNPINRAKVKKTFCEHWKKFSFKKVNLNDYKNYREIEA